MREVVERFPPARIFHELLAATTDMAVLPGVLGCRPLRRTVQVRLGFDFRFRILDLGFFTTIDDIELNISDFAICFLVRSAFRNPHSAIVNPVARPPRLSEQARDGGQAHPSSSRSLRSAQSRKRVPSFVVSRQQFLKYPG
jgi:hypothetical protein